MAPPVMMQRSDDNAAASRFSIRWRIKGTSDHNLDFVLGDQRTGMAGMPSNRLVKTISAPRMTPMNSAATPKP